MKGLYLTAIGLYRCLIFDREERASRIKLTCVEGAIVGLAQSGEVHYLRPGK